MRNPRPRPGAGKAGVLANHASLTMDPVLEQAGRGLLGLGATISAEQFWPAGPGTAAAWDAPVSAAPTPFLLTRPPEEHNVVFVTCSKHGSYRPRPMQVDAQPNPSERLIMSQTHEVTIPSVTLNNGVRIPQLGFGVFQVPPGETQRIVEDALEAGYRHIDTAAAYRNEAEVGAALAASGIPRGDLFVTTKLRNGEQGIAQEAFRNSLAAMGLDYVDLYLIHWPVPSHGLFTQAWKVMERLYAEGLSRAIGVSNFLPEHLDALLSAAEVVPAVNQIEIHPTFQQQDLAAKSRSLGIAVEAYSPLGQGSDLDAAAVKSLAAKYGATPARIVLAWHLAQGNIVIPKSGNSARMRENLSAAGLSLTPAETAAITALESGARIGADPAVAAHSQM